MRGYEDETGEMMSQILALPRLFKSLALYARGRSLIWVFLVALLTYTIACYELITPLEIVMSFPGTHRIVEINSANSLPIYATLLIAICLSPRNPVGDHVASARLRRYATACIGIFSILIAPSHLIMVLARIILLHRLTILADQSMQEILYALTAQALIPMAVIIMLIALFGKIWGTVCALAFSCTYIAMGAYDLWAPVSPLNLQYPQYHCAQAVGGCVLYALALWVWYRTAASAPIARMLKLPD